MQIPRTKNYRENCKKVTFILAIALHDHSELATNSHLYLNQVPVFRAGATFGRSRHGARIFKPCDRHKSLDEAFLRFDKVHNTAGSTSSLINETVSPLDYLMHTYLHGATFAVYLHGRVCFLLRRRVSGTYHARARENSLVTRVERRRNYYQMETRGRRIKRKSAR